MFGLPFQFDHFLDNRKREVEKKMSSSYLMSLQMKRNDLESLISSTENMVLYFFILT